MEKSSFENSELHQKLANGSDGSDEILLIVKPERRDRASYCAAGAQNFEKLCNCSARFHVF